MIKAIGYHTEEVVPAVEPTCTDTGLTEGKKCSVCGEILAPQETINATGHTDENDDGICDVCGKKIPLYSGNCYTDYDWYYHKYVYKNLVAHYELFEDGELVIRLAPGAKYTYINYFDENWKREYKYLVTKLTICDGITRVSNDFISYNENLK